MTNQLDNKNDDKKKHHHVLPTPKFAPIITVALITLVVGTAFYSYVENLSVLDALYFCVMTLTTVGYGSIEIVTTPGKIFTIFYAIFGVGIIASAANYLIQKTLAHHAKHEADKDS